MVTGGEKRGGGEGLTDMNKLLNDNHHLLGLRLKIRLASNVHTYFGLKLNVRFQECSFSSEIASTSSASVVDALASRASRTLYVGGLERRTSDDSLRNRFGHFGHILEIVRRHTISGTCNQFLCTFDDTYVWNKRKANWGRTIVSNKIWISEVPPSCSADYLREKMRVSFTDTFSEVIYDPRYREALLLFVNNDSAQRAFSLIKMRQM
ncbi:unnamed protein product [Gongylonema pulchrum]|uniref:RRM domain-containing protein n=1 Tax=Gongylonema pulchrum TaxID=637853 RepID=A0A183DPI0_9BILA|nr:unnamed protein product [Gongylonema pulchrum]